jgi:hypothetical protein
MMVARRDGEGYAQNHAVMMWVGGGNTLALRHRWREHLGAGCTSLVSAPDLGRRLALAGLAGVSTVNEDC